jgi:RHS repeat-associated protein
VWGNETYRVGWGGRFGSYTTQYQTFTDNRRDGFAYDLAGNITHDGVQAFSYDATGQQTYASGTGLEQWYDGDGLRARKRESGADVYYLRSSALGGRVVAEVRYNPAYGGWYWSRGYVYAGQQLLAIQDSELRWVHQDPVTKGQRLTDINGAVTAAVDLDPWGGETARSSNQHQQPQRYTSYLRDAGGSDEAMFRRYSPQRARFDQPDPYDGSYDLSDPQSLNRYSYALNDPVDFVDPTGLVTYDGHPGREWRGSPQDPVLGGRERIGGLTWAHHHGRVMASVRFYNLGGEDRQRDWWFSFGYSDGPGQRWRFPLPDGLERVRRIGDQIRREQQRRENPKNVELENCLQAARVDFDKHMMAGVTTKPADLKPSMQDVTTAGVAKYGFNQSLGSSFGIGFGDTYLQRTAECRRRHAR